MRKLVIALVGFELLALTACGYTIAEDTELTAAISWAREFKAEQPEVSRTIAQGCIKAQAAAPSLTRAGALQLFQCIRREAEARGLA